MPRRKKKLQSLKMSHQITSIKPVSSSILIFFSRFEKQLFPLSSIFMQLNLDFSLQGSVSCNTEDIFKPLRSFAIATSCARLANWSHLPTQHDTNAGHDSKARLDNPDVFNAICWIFLFFSAHSPDLFVARSRECAG